MTEQQLRLQGIINFKLTASYSLSSKRASAEEPKKATRFTYGPSRPPAKKDLKDRRGPRLHPCPACQRLNCRLPTHKAYAQHLKSKSDGVRPLFTTNAGVTNDSLGSSRSVLPPPLHNPRQDPFTRYPIPMTPDLHRLVNQWYTPWRADFRGPERHIFPRNRFECVLPGILKDQAGMYAILALTATQQSVIRTGKVDEYALELQTKAVQCQMEATKKDEVASDVRILTALSIMSNHMAAGNAMVVKEHMQAIEVFVKRRGGIHYLGMDGNLADNLALGDHTKAVVYNTKPVYEMSLPPIPPDERLACFFQRMGTGFRELYLAGILDEQVYCATVDMNRLLDIFNRAVAGICTKQEAGYFEYLSQAYELEAAISNSTYHGTGTMNECICLAFLLINHTLFRSHGALNPLVPLIETRFWTCFRKIRKVGLLDERGDLVVWLVLSGMITHLRATPHFSNEAVSVLGRSVADGAYFDWDLVEQKVLDKYGWSKLALEHLYKKYWQTAVDVEDEAMINVKADAEG